MDAQELFRDGVLAIRDRQDLAQGRALLIQSLKLNPQNDQAWLWLTRTTTDPQKQLQCVERALQINPDNPKAQALKARLTHTPAESPERALARPESALSPSQPAQPSRSKNPPANAQVLRAKPSAADVRRIETMLARAEGLLNENDTEGAIEQWVHALQIQPDHELAMRNALKHLWRLGYADDAKQLIWRAIDRGTSVPSIYLTAHDLAERENNYADQEKLRSTVATLPQIEDKLILTFTDRYVASGQVAQALEFLQLAHEHRPSSQAILLRLGDLYQEIGRADLAMKHYEQVLHLGPRTEAGKEADLKLVGRVPTLGDRERGSVWLATREALGVGAFFFFMAWQDAGLNLLSLGLTRWLGVLLAYAGGYLMVTATSSPQQQPLAQWLGGEIPPPPNPSEDADDPLLLNSGVEDIHTKLPIIPTNLRYFLAMVGLALLIVAFLLVFHEAIDLVRDFTPPDLPNADEL